MSQPFWEWDRAEERSLARFVGAELPATLHLPPYINRLDLIQAEGIEGLVGQLYALLRRQGLRYDLAPFDPRPGITQRIRKPETILREKTGTCLDLVVLFAGLCLAHELLPVIVLVEGHAFAGVSRTRTRQSTARVPKRDAWDRGILHDWRGIRALPVLRDLTASEYLIVECTGLAQSTAALDGRFPEGRWREASGYMSFERACAAGQEQVQEHTRADDEPLSQERRTFLYALDIHDLQVNQGIESQEATAMSTDRGSGDGGSRIDTEGGAYIGGSVNAGGKFVGRDDYQQGDDITVGNITGATGVAIGRQAQAHVTQGVPPSGLAELFKVVYGQIQTRPEDPLIDKQELVETVQKVETEAAKGEQANPDRVKRWLTTLADVAPDVLDITIKALVNPAAGVAAAIRTLATQIIRRAS